MNESARSESRKEGNKEGNKEARKEGNKQGRKTLGCRRGLFHRKPWISQSTWKVKSNIITIQQPRLVELVEVFVELSNQLVDTSIISWLSSSMGTYRFQNIRILPNNPGMDPWASLYHHSSSLTKSVGLLWCLLRMGEQRSTTTGSR